MGEQNALAELESSLHGKFTPLIEIPFIEFDYKQQVLKDTPEHHLEKISNSLYDKLIEPNAYIDFRLMELKKQLKNSDLIKKFYQKISESKCRIIPVISSYSSKVTIDAVRHYLANGLCIRLSLKDLENINVSLSAILDNFPETNITDIDLVIDMESISEYDSSVLKVFTETTFKSIPLINKWRTLILSSSTFPIDLSNIKRDTVAKLPRLEWHNWMNALENSNIVRKPIFSDYPIAHPDIKDLDFRMITTSASIRYSDYNSWIVVKGRSIKSVNQTIQYIEKSKILIAREEYFGNEYSWGDSFIYKCAHSSIGDKCGNSTTWRQVGVNHHLTLVIDQLSSLS